MNDSSSGYSDAEELKKKLGRKVREYRKIKNMEAKELSELSQVTASMISQIERGKALASHDVLSRISNVLELNSTESRQLAKWRDEAFLTNKMADSDNKRRMANSGNIARRTAHDVATSVPTLGRRTVHDVATSVPTLGTLDDGASTTQGASANMSGANDPTLSRLTVMCRDLLTAASEDPLFADKSISFLRMFLNDYQRNG